MKKSLFALFLGGFCCSGVSAQMLDTNRPSIDKVFHIATETLYNNVKDSIIHAGGTYGGEWTRDISINAWNASNLLIPEATRYSLWSVTTDQRSYIGHQYWDQIIWVTGAYDHYLATGDQTFLTQAYKVAKNTILKLEKEVFDAQYGLFTGPSVFNDGIAGYEEPIYQPDVNRSYVLDYPHSKQIKCLSTNCIYYHAYELLAEMSVICKDTSVTDYYLEKAAKLRGNIRQHLWNSEENKLYYLIDNNGKVHQHQEGLGISFAILFGVVSQVEAAKLVDQAYVSPYGLPSIYPCFKRFSKEKPGRHNVMVWPFVNAFWAEAALLSNRPDKFVFELENMAQLVESSNDCFYEIYNCYTGKVSGGWQSGDSREWDSVYKQTWSATGYVRMILRGVLGMKFRKEGLEIAPNAYLLEHLGFHSLKDLRYQEGKLQIIRKGKGNRIQEIRVNGIQAGAQRVVIPSGLKGNITIDIIMN